MIEERTLPTRLRCLSTETLRVLYTVAKHPAKGARPFFRDPKAMIALREEIERRSDR